LSSRAVIVLIWFSSCIISNFVLIQILILRDVDMMITCLLLSPKIQEESVSFCPYQTPSPSSWLYDNINIKGYVWFLFVFLIIQMWFFVFYFQSFIIKNKKWIQRMKTKIKQGIKILVTVMVVVTLMKIFKEKFKSLMILIFRVLDFDKVLSKSID